MLTLTYLTSLLLYTSAYSNLSPPDLSSLNQNDCPLWFHCNETLHGCQCPPDSLFTSKGNDSFVKSGHLTTYNHYRGVVSTTYGRSCLLFLNPNSTKTWYKLLPRNISRLNEYTCGPLNRKGYLCKDCIDGYGLAMNLMMCTSKCYSCTTKHLHLHGTTVYLIMEFLPLTLFYFVILTFRIRMTSAPMTCYILYSQIIVIAFYYAWQEPLLSQVVYTESGILRPLSKVIVTLYGIFNLDLLRDTLPPFCISTQLQPVHRLLLGYISAVYPLVLIALTWLCIRLHDNNFKLVVLLWKPLHRCFVHLKKGWNTRNDLIDVFSSFFLLSYSKFMYLMLVILSTTRRYNYSLAVGYISDVYVMDADVSVMTSSVQYITLAIFVGLVCITFNILPVLVLTLYPFNLFRRALSRCGLNDFALTIFVERFHSSYRDGLSGGKDMRIFAGLYFLLRILECVGVLFLYDVLDFEQWFLRGTLLLITALVIALCRPYKTIYMNVSDVILLSHMATVCYILSSDTENVFFVPFMQILILIPFVALTLMIVFRIIHRLVPELNSMFQCLIRRNGFNTEQSCQLTQPLIKYGATNE